MGIMLPAVIALALIMSFGQSSSIAQSAPALNSSDFNIWLVLEQGPSTASAHDAPALLAILFQIHVDHDLAYAVVARVSVNATKTTGPQRDTEAHWCALYG